MCRLGPANAPPLRHFKNNQADKTLIKMQTLAISVTVSPATRGDAEKRWVGFQVMAFASADKIEGLRKSIAVAPARRLTSENRYAPCQK